MRHAFEKTVTYLYVPHAMTFTNIYLCRPCHGVNIAKSQNFTRINDATDKSVKYTDSYFSSILVVNLSLFGYCETCYDNKDKKIDETWF